MPINLLDNLRRLFFSCEYWLTGDDDMLDDAKKEGVNPAELEEVLVVDTKKLHDQCGSKLD